ncbi:MAG: M3 family metallopeptidase, partial [Eubacteriales bacterium]|nr:M3 family metallopeptidase [Eubacteriales bacterium]
MYKKRTASIIVFIFILVNIFGVNAFALEEKYAENPVLKFAYDESLNKANIVDDILYSLYSTDSNELIDRIVGETSGLSQDYAVSKGFSEEFQIYDYYYYLKKYKEDIYSFNEESLRPYFE